MKIERKWAMPSKNTFQIKPIKELIELYIEKNEGLKIDPFAGINKLVDITNDIDFEYDTDYHLDAIDFLHLFGDNDVSLIFFDPPYSPRQVSEVYRKLGKTVNMQTTQASYWGILKREIARIIKKNGVVISCAWNSGGIGKKYGFEIEEILLVAHGGWHNDTIITVERKIK